MRIAKQMQDKTEQLKLLQIQYDKIKDSCQNAFQSILSMFNERKSFKLSNHITMEIYNQIYNYIEKTSDPSNSSKNSSQINESLKSMETLFKLFVAKYVQTLKLDQNNLQCEQIIETFNEQFQNFLCFTKWFSFVFRHYEQITQTKPNLSTIAIQIFDGEYFSKYQHILKDAIFELFQISRQTSSIPLIKTNLIKLYSYIQNDSLNIERNLVNQEIEIVEMQTRQIQQKQYYEKSFQNPYIQKIEQYYNENSKYWMELQAHQYIEKSLKALQLESELADIYYPFSKKAIINSLEMNLIKRQGELIYDKQGSGMTYMLNNDKFEDLANLFKLFSRVQEKLPLLAIRFREHLEKIGNQFNMLESEGQKQQQGKLQHVAEIYVNKILELMKRAEKILKECFQEEIEQSKALKQGFSNILNQNDKSPLNLAIVCDILFKSSENSDADFQQKINDIVRIFQYIHQRDIFFKHYQKFMSVRLIAGSSKNMDAEKQMLLKFKSEAGAGSISNLQIMLGDVQISEQFMAQYKQQFQTSLKYDFTALSLSKNAWHLQIQVQEHIPPFQMQKAIKLYTELFQKQYQGRELNWIFSQGIGEVIFKSNKDRFYLNLTTLQMLVFLQFNQRDSWSVNELIQLTKITKNDLEINMIPLIISKVIQRQKQDLDDFDDYEILQIQWEFTHRQKKLRLIPNAKTAPKRLQNQQQISIEDQQQNEMIQKEREIVIESHLVRIMKSRRKLKHQELVQQCMQLINLFKPDQNMIKKRIESLIEREYFKRDDNDVGTYHYIN